MPLVSLVDHLREKYSNSLPPNFAITAPIATPTLMRDYAFYSTQLKWMAQCNRTLEEYGLKPGV